MKGSGMPRFGDAWSKAELVLKCLIWISFFATVWGRETGVETGEQAATHGIQLPRRKWGLRIVPFLKESVLFDLDLAELEILNLKETQAGVFVSPALFLLVVAEQRVGGKSCCAY